MNTFERLKLMSLRPLLLWFTLTKTIKKRDLVHLMLQVPKRNWILTRHGRQKNEIMLGIHHMRKYKSLRLILKLCNICYKYCRGIKPWQDRGGRKINWCWECMEDHETETPLTEILLDKAMNVDDNFIWYEGVGRIWFWSKKTVSKTELLSK